MRWEWDGSERPAGRRLAILAIEKVSHGFPAGFVGFFLSLAFVGVRGLLRFGTVCSGSLHSGQRLAKPGLSGFSSNSSEQTAQTRVGNAIQILCYKPR